MPYSLWLQMNQFGFLITFTSFMLAINGIRVFNSSVTRPVSFACRAKGDCFPFHFCIRLARFPEEKDNLKFELKRKINNTETLSVFSRYSLLGSYEIRSSNCYGSYMEAVRHFGVARFRKQRINSTLMEIGMAHFFQTTGDYLLRQLSRRKKNFAVFHLI